MNENTVPLSTITRPEIVTDEHLTYLDDLRDSGETNMFGARPFLMAEFPELTTAEARSIVLYWMESFSARHPIVAKS